MQETTPRALTPDEAVEVMDRRAKNLTDAANQGASIPGEPYRFYLVTATIQKREDKYKYKPRTIKGIVRTNAHYKIRPAVEALMKEYLDKDDAYIKKVDARKLETDFFIPEA